MDNLWRELERSCERVTHELSQFNDRLDQNKNVMSPADLDNLYKMMDIIKDVKSTMKKIIEIDAMENGDEIQNGYSGTYMSQPVWDKRYSGNSYHGTYTVATGDRDGYSGRRGMRRMYSRDTEHDNIMSELDTMLNNARDDREADIIRKLMTKL